MDRLFFRLEAKKPEKEEDILFTFTCLNCGKEMHVVIGKSPSTDCPHCHFNHALSLQNLKEYVEGK